MHKLALPVLSSASSALRLGGSSASTRATARLILSTGAERPGRCGGRYAGARCFRRACTRATSARGALCRRGSRRCRGRAACPCPGSARAAGAVRPRSRRGCRRRSTSTTRRESPENADPPVAEKLRLPSRRRKRTDPPQTGTTIGSNLVRGPVAEPLNLTFTLTRTDVGLTFTWRGTLNCALTVMSGEFAEAGGNRMYTRQ